MYVTNDEVIKWPIFNNVKVFFFFFFLKNYTINLLNWNLIKSYYHEQIPYVETLKIKTKFTQLYLFEAPVLPHSPNLHSQWCTTSSMWLTHQLEEECWLQSFSLHLDDEDQEALGYKTLRRKDAVTSFRENNALGLFLHVFSLYSLIWQSLK